jgi:uncharacterized protein YbaR (Trm112 family)
LKKEFETMLDNKTKNCLKCIHFDEQKETCKEFNAKPPARIICHGCEKYFNIDDEIPF